MNTESPAIRHLFISQEHNFVGHNGREADTFPTLDLPEVELRAGSGIVGDRYFDHQPDYKGQVTFFAEETFLRIRESFQRNDLVASVFRRNVMTSGLDLNELIGVEFELQGVRFQGTEEARPCHWMNRTIAEGVKEAMEGFGGLRARILTDGVLRVGPCNLLVLTEL
jgi:MOSC domain-containing protein YiiM